MGKKAWETTIERLEAQLEDARTSTATQVNSLQQELAALRQIQPLEMKVLMSEKHGYPALAELFRQLRWLTEAATPGRGANIDPDTSNVTVKGIRSVDEGAPTRRYAHLRRKADDWIADLAEKIASQMDGTRERVERPRCKSRSCRLRDRRQDIDAKRCKECGGELSYPKAS